MQKLLQGAVGLFRNQKSDDLNRFAEKDKSKNGPNRHRTQKNLPYGPLFSGSAENAERNRPQPTPLGVIAQLLGGDSSGPSDNDNSAACRE
jgi:hypothetical protein